MKHLLSGVAVAAVLAIAAPAWAQSPTGGNALGTPGPNPGGPGLTPYSSGAAAPPASTSATPPMHHHAMVHHAHVMHAFHKRMAHEAHMAGDTTAALNRQELARIQSGNLGNPPAPSGPMGEGPPGSPQPAPSH